MDFSLQNTTLTKPYSHNEQEREDKTCLDYVFF